MPTVKQFFPARYKAPFENVKARMDFRAFLANRGAGLTITALAGNANFLILDEPDTIPSQWGSGVVGSASAGAVKVASPYLAFSITTSSFDASGFIDLILHGGEVGKTYLVTVGFTLSNGETLYRSAAITVAQL